MVQYSQFKAGLPAESKCNLIIVNDGSTYDLVGGFEIIKSQVEKSTIIAYEENKGKGYALRTGVEASSADIILLTDHDMPYAVSSMLEIIHVLNESNENHVVIGHRDKAYYRDMPFLRVKVSHYLKTINRFILGLKTDDTQCGLKVFRNSVRDIFLSTKTNRFLIDIEFLRRLRRKKIEVKVIDVQVREGIELSKVGLRIMITEFLSYLKIFFTT